MHCPQSARHRSEGQWAVATRTAGAFTLLEIVVVLVIISLLLGLGVMSFDGILREQEFRRPATGLKRMVQDAVRRARLDERPQVIVFEAGGFAMQLKKPAGEPGGAEPGWDRVSVPSSMRLSIRRFGGERFLPAAGQMFVVAPGGLCEPITARFEEGSSWMQITIDPLSGGVREESMVIE